MMKQFAGINQQAILAGYTGTSPVRFWLQDGRGVVGTEVDRQNRLVYVVRDKAGTTGPELVYAEQTRVIPQLPPAKRTVTTISFAGAAVASEPVTLTPGSLTPIPTNSSPFPREAAGNQPSESAPTASPTMPLGTGRA